jgi:hypothetical protein
MRRHLSILTLTCAVCVTTSHLHAADVTFQPFGQPAVDAATDLAYTGTLDRAYAFGAASSVGVNGIVFTPFSSNSHSDTTNLSASSKYSGSGLTGGYASLVSTGVSLDGSQGTIQFNGLVPGAVYTANVIGMGLRARSDCCSVGAGYTNLFIAGDTPVGGGTIHWDGNDAASRNIRGTFIADSSGIQTLYLNRDIPGGTDPLTVSANINAVMLSYAAVPEPTSLALLLASAIGTVFVRRRARSHFQNRGLAPCGYN